MKTQIAKVQSILNQKQPNPRKAIKILNSLLKGQSTPWPVFHFMGVAQMQRKHFEKAIDYLMKALKRGSQEAETFHLISVSYFHLAKFDRAEEFAQKALERKEDFFEAWLNLGSVYRAKAQLDIALQCYQKANQLDPSSAGVAFRIGSIFNDQGNLNKAIELYDITLKIDPEYLEAQAEKAKIFQKQQKFKKAKECIQYVLDREKQNLGAHMAMADIYKSEGLYIQALNIYQEILAQEPKMAEARVNYALCLQELGRFDDSEKQYLRALEDRPDLYEAYSNYLMGLHYNPQRTKEEIFDAHLQWDKQFSDVQVQRPVPANKNKNKRLRIGFISGGFRRHPVGWMITKALENLPPKQFEIYCYTTNNLFDSITKRIHNCCTKWRSVMGYNDEVTAQIIRDDEIDILVELSGHSEDNRLQTVIREPAPIIVKWVGGLFNTSGLEAIDYLLTDWNETPKGEEELYTEKLVRMPDDYICYLAPDYAPKVGTLPALENGYVTFGCFNNPTKVNTEVLDQWAKIMRQVPNSRLFLKSKQYGSQSYIDLIAEHMQANGIDSSRLIFEGQSTHDTLLAAYNRVDIALDPWPYSGGLSTCEALWMGVPVLTLPGPTFAGRHSLTHLTNAGLNDFVAKNWDDYIGKAVALALDLTKLSDLRSSLRVKVVESPLYDGERFAAHLGRAFREMWRQLVERYQTNKEGWADHISIKALPKEEKVKRQKSPDELRTKSGSVNDQQLNKIADKEPFKITLAEGVIIFAPADLENSISYRLLEKEQDIEPEIGLLTDLLKPGMVAVDLEAQLGIYTIPMAQAVGEAGRVYAFESDSGMVRHLELSKLENKLSQLQIYKMGLSGFNNESGQKSEAIDNSVRLDAWWKFSGQPKVDLVSISGKKIDIDVLKGADSLIDKNEPIILVKSTGNSSEIVGQEELLKKMGYYCYKYISEIGILTRLEPEDLPDGNLKSIVAVPNSKLQDLVDRGLIFIEDMEFDAPESGCWKRWFANLPWSNLLDSVQELSGHDDNMADYFIALDYIVSAEQVSAKKEGNAWRNCRTDYLLNAAKLLIGFYNQGKKELPVTLTLSRVLLSLGKRNQAAELLNQLLDTEFRTQEVTLPFLPTLPSQDQISTEGSLEQWLTLRLVEAWVVLSNSSTYEADDKTLELIEALDGNPEVINRVKRAVYLNKTRKGKKSAFEDTEYIKSQNNWFFNSTTTDNNKEVQSDLMTNDVWDASFYKLISNIIRVNGSEKGSRHSLPGELVVSLTSYPKRFKFLPLTLLSLVMQSIKPDRIILWIAYEDKSHLTKDILDFERLGVEIRYCQDLKSYKKIVPTLKAFPDAYIVVADDDLYYRNDWLAGLVRKYEIDSNEVVAYRAHRIAFDKDGSLKPYQNWGWEYRKDTTASVLNFPTSGAGTLYPPGIFHPDVCRQEIFTNLAPKADDVWLYWMVRLNGAKVRLTDAVHPLIEWPQENGQALWKKNILEGGNDKQIANMIDRYGFPEGERKPERESPETDKNIFRVTVNSRQISYKMKLPDWTLDHIQKIIATGRKPYEEQMLLDMVKKVKPGDLILDVGANIGNHSLFMATVGNCRVMAFEPNPRVSKAFAESVQLNRLSKQITIIEKGVGQKCGYGHFEQQLVDNIGAQRLALSSEAENTQTIEIVTLDSLNIKNTVQLIKVDVEGMDLQVLKGAQKLITRNQPVIYVEGATTEEFNPINTFLSGLDYQYHTSFNATPTHLFLPASY